MALSSLKQKQNVSIFVTRKKLHNEPSLKPDGSEILVVDEYKFFRIIDKKTNIHSPLGIPKN